MQWLERWVRPKTQGWKHMMYGGAGIALGLSILLALSGAAQIFLSITRYGHTLIHPVPGWAVAGAAFLASYFLFRVHRVYLHVARNPDPEPATGSSR